MKKLLSIILALPLIASAAPWDLNGQQYDQFGTSMINRLMPLPSGGASAIYIYNASLNLPKLATVDSTLSISSGSVVGISSSTLSGLATTSALAGKFDNPIGTTSQYLRGDGTLATFPMIPASQVNSDWNAVSGVSQILNKPTAVSAFTNDAGYLVSSALTPYATTVSLTTGLATKFDIPTGTTAQYVRGDGTLATLPAPGTGTVTSITAGTGLSGGVITTTGTISMPNTGTAGTYSGVTTDAQGRVTAGTNASQSAQTRTLNTIYQISATRGAFVFYSVQITVTASISGGQDGDCILEIASDSGFTTNVQTLQVSPGSQSYTLAIALQGVQKGSVNVSGYVPAGYYARIRTVNNTGTPAFLYRAGQEVLM